MSRSDCLFERAASVSVAIALLFMAVGLIVIGVTVLPILGILLSIPVWIAASAFLFSPRSEECTIY